MSRATWSAILLLAVLSPETPATGGVGPPTLLWSAKAPPRPPLR
jgi:hypothetical protein